ncbi:MAG: Nif3-like dinuclear metal center hexameric protein [Candidatus Brockarchaeota archaeon]|nr:Nif3-like dinuclear metal center hexameric protein [Candidatus Brockarchaeota archaeon]
MKAVELHRHMQEIGTWVDWQRTRDQFLAGDPESEVEGIAVSWMPTFFTLNEALKAGCNLFVTHEPLYSAVVDGKGRVVGGAVLKEAGVDALIGKDDAWVKKAAWLEEKGVVVYRCHDVWDNFPGIGIHGAWAKWLGFDGKPILEKRYYEVHEVGNVAVRELAHRILQKVKPLGQDAVGVVGDLGKRVSRIALGTGAATDYREMHSMEADVLLLTDDGTRLWESGQWSLDSGVPIIIVNHSTSEEPGMRTLAKYIKEKFPHVPVVEIPVGCIYNVIK